MITNVVTHAITNISDVPGAWQWGLLVAAAGLNLLNGLSIAGRRESVENAREEKQEVRRRLTAAEVKVGELGVKVGDLGEETGRLRNEVILLKGLIALALPKLGVDIHSLDHPADQ